jgi:predicted AAA+ superfamily ATPase
MTTKEILNKILTNDNIKFLTGPGGSGKTYMVNLIKE